jgi:hypothetical protein
MNRNTRIAHLTSTTETCTTMLISKMNTMNLPKFITDLVEAQNSHDGAAYASLFSDSAVVYDEGQTHNGRVAIQRWIEKSNEENQTVLRPIGYEQSENGSVFTAEISGTFPGSPAVLNFNLVLQQGLIQSLKITG